MAAALVSPRRVLPPRRGRVLGLASVCAILLLLAPRWSRPSGASPAPIDDAAFWRMFSEFSEPNGYFRSDNFVSNERTFQEVIPTLRTKAPSGGAYLGVGPDQNFTYLVALRPRIAFIVDIRRQNALLHLLYKALLELSADRADFLSRLFSRPQPAELTRHSTAQALFDAYEKVAPSRDLHQQQRRAAIDHLVKHHHFPLTDEDRRTIEYVYDAFFQGGPDISYTSSSFRGYLGYGPPGGGWRRFPSYAELMLATDLAGENHSYLASDENFQALRALERANEVVPVVGDFAGEKALRAVGAYLEAHDTKVSAFYTSNVEFYLFQNDRWNAFVSNVRTLPLDATSTFIRASSRNFRTGPGNQLGNGTLLDPIKDLVAAAGAGRIQSYRDLLERSRPPGL
jgi:hypothetical protein